jgi:hypothetical protein
MKNVYVKTIFVVESGWVFLCESYTTTDTGYVLHEASVIREWGTTKGLGEIALNGPTGLTVLDSCGTPEIPAGKVLFKLPCFYG